MTAETRAKIAARLEAIVTSVFTTLLGLLLASFFGFMMFLELKNGMAGVKTSHIVSFTIMIAIGMGMASPELFFGSIKKVVVVVVDARKNGLRWTDPKDDANP